MKFKNIGVITSIKQSLNSKEITIKLDNYLDDEKYNIIYFCDQKIGTVTGGLLLGTQLLVKDDFLFDIKGFEIQNNKKYEFEFQIVTTNTNTNTNTDNTNNTVLLNSNGVIVLKDLKDISSNYTLKIISITEKAL